MTPIATMPTKNQHIYTISGENGAKMLKKPIFAIKLCFYVPIFLSLFNFPSLLNGSNIRCIMIQHCAVYTR